MGRSDFRRHAVTLIELVIAFALVAVLVTIGYQTFFLLGRQEKKVTRKATEAIKQAQMMETLLRDLRSAESVLPDGSGGYSIQRYRSGPSGGVMSTVVWERLGPAQLRRSEAGGSNQTFDFRDVLDPEHPLIEFQIERVENVVFQP